jgi:hypothetical protein
MVGLPRDCPIFREQIWPMIAASGAHSQLHGRRLARAVPKHRPSYEGCLCDMLWGRDYDETDNINDQLLSPFLAVGRCTCPCPGRTSGVD